MADTPQVWVESSASSDAESGPLYLGIQSVNVFVRDLDQSSKFYVEQLGFELVSDVILQSGQRRVGVAPPDGSAVLTLIAPEPESAERKFIGQATHIVFVTQDVPAKYLEWKKRGVHFRHTPRLRRIQYRQHAPARLSGRVAGAEAPVWGGVFTQFEDPDGNSFSLMSIDEISRDIEAQRLAAAEKAESERRAAPRASWKLPRKCSSSCFPRPCRPSGRSNMRASAFRRAR